MSPLPHELLAELVGDAMPGFKAAGLGIWSGLAFIAVLWAAIRTAASRRFDAWEASWLVVALVVARALLAVY